MSRSGQPELTGDGILDTSNAVRGRLINPKRLSGPHLKRLLRRAESGETPTARLKGYSMKRSYEQIPITKNMIAIVDGDDIDLKNHKWFFGSGGYAARREQKSRSLVLMHRVILERKLGRKFTQLEEVDHINRRKLDNRRVNLRVADRRINNINKDIQANNTSGYRGVHWHKGHKKWHATIKSRGKRYHLGYFDDPKEAALQYNLNAMILHDGYALLNDV